MAGLEPKCQAAYLPQRRHGSLKKLSFPPCSVYILIMPDRKYLCKPWPTLVTPGGDVGLVESTTRYIPYCQGFIYTCGVQRMQQNIYLIFTSHHSSVHIEVALHKWEIPVLL